MSERIWTDGAGNKWYHFGNLYDVTTPDGSRGVGLTEIEALNDAHEDDKWQTE